LACAKENWEEARELIDDEKTNVNWKRPLTPLYYAASAGNLGFVKKLLERDDLKLNEKDFTESALFIASVRGFLFVVEALLASPSECDVEGVLSYTRSQGIYEIVYLLSSYFRNPDIVRFELRKAHGWDGLHLILTTTFIILKFLYYLILFIDIFPHPTKAQLFALTILMADGYLELKKKEFLRERAQKAQRFFRICCDLPVELKMVITRMAFRLSHKDFFLADETEKGLRTILRGFS